MAFERSGGGVAASKVALVLAACAGWSAGMATAVRGEGDTAPTFGDAGRLRPYVIEAPADRRAERSQQQRPVTPPDRQGEAVPAPVPVTQHQAAAGPRSAAGRAAGGCANPNALGVSREVEIDATGGPRYGFQQYKLIDFLREGEIVLTFDDGPVPAYTKPILQALEHHCTKATFFIVGRNALAYPEIVRDEAARGHTIGNHTWSHANLGPRRIVPKRTPQAADDQGQQGLSLAGPAGPALMTSSVGGIAGPEAAAAAKTFAPPMSPEKAMAEIELGFSATSRALGAPMAPFFRFPYLGNSTAMHNYLAERNVAVFSIDVDSVDYRAKRAEDVINRVMTDLKDQKKGILLFHDIQPATAQAMPALLDLLKSRGYKVVHLKPKAGLQTIAAFDARVGKDGIKQDAIAEKKPLVKRTMTWGMQPGGAQPGETNSAVAARASDASTIARVVKKPVARSEFPARGDSPGYIAPGSGQPEVLPWLTLPRRNNGW